MAKTGTYTRRINLFINGKEIKNDVKSVQGEMTKLINAQRKMTIGSEEYVRTGKQIQSLNGVMQQHRGQLKQTESMWGKLTRTVGGLKTMAVAAIGAAVVKVFTSVVKQTKEFEEALSGLSAITGATGLDLQFYSDEAIKMSKNSTKSAKDVVKAMELIGGAKPELLKNKEALAEVTRETIVLAEAAKMSMPEAASALTKAMNQFSMPAEEAGRTINVLAAGSKNGAAAIPEITDALLTFGTVADNSNVTLEQSVGLIETLAEKGMVGAKAGTSLRNVLLELQKGGDETNPKIVGLSTAIENLAAKNLSAAELAQRFGKESVVAAQILTNNVDKVNYYTKAVTGTTTAYEQQATQTNNLANSWTKFKNMFSSLLLTVGNGSNLSGFLSSVVQSATKVVGVFGKWISIPIEKKIRDEQREVFALTSRLTDANTSAEQRRKILVKLREISPKIVSGLEAENLNYKQLRENINAYNKEVTNRIIMGKLQESEEENLTSLASARVKEAQLLVDIQAKMVEINQDVALGEGTREEKLKRITQLLIDQVKLQKETGATNPFYSSEGQSIFDPRTDDQVKLHEIIRLSTELNKVTEERTQLESKSVDYSERINQLREILGLNAEIITPDPEDPDPTDPDPLFPDADESDKKLKELNDKRLSAEQQLAEKIAELRRQLHLDTLDANAREIDEINFKYQSLLDTAAEFGMDETALVELRQQEIEAAEDRHAAERLKLKAELEAKIFDATANAADKEIKATTDKFMELIELAEQFGLDTTELYRKMNEELDLIRNGITGEDAEKDIFGMTQEQWDSLFENMHSVMALMQEVSQIWGNVNTIMANRDKQEVLSFEKRQKKQKDSLNSRLESGMITQEIYNARIAKMDAELDKKKEDIAKRQADREKKLQIFNAIVNTAAAVIKSLNSPPPLNFVLAGLTAAAGATQIAAISSAPPAYAAGGYTQGERMYIAGEAGREWIANNAMLNNPYTAAVIADLEAVQRGILSPAVFAPSQPNYEDMMSIPMMRNGGFIPAGGEQTAAASGASGSDFQQMVGLLAELNQYMRDPNNRRAFIVYTDLRRHEDEMSMQSSLQRIAT